MDYSLGLYIVGGFLLVNLLLGLWAGKDVKDIRDYAVGNKRWGVGEITMTYLATTFSGCNLMRSLRSFAMFGIAPLWSTAGLAVSGLFRYFFIAPNILNFSNCISLGDVFLKLYGKNARIFAGFIGTSVCILFVGMQIQVLATICENFLDLEYKTGAIYCALLISVYTSLGGMRSVMSTDIMQFIFIILGIFFVATYSLNTAGGVKNIIKTLPETNLNFFRVDYIYTGISIFILQAFFGVEMIDSGTFQRVLMTDSPKILKKVFLLTIIGWLVYVSMRFFMSSSSIILNSESSSNVLLYLVNNVVPVSIKPLVIIGLMAIVFSSADSFLHGASIAFTYDFLGSFFPQINKKLHRIKLFSLILGIVSIYISLMDLIYLPLSSTFAAITAPTICFPLLVGMAGLQASNRVFLLQCQ